MARLSRWLRRTLVGLGSTAGGLLLVVLVSLLIPGCAVGYVTRQSMTHLHVLAARQSIEKADRRGAIEEAWRPKLEIIAAARDFGVRELGLPAGDLYRKISLVHPDPNWIVTASARDALAPVTWWFPVVGRVAYRGYYDRDDAERFADGLRARDLDVLVRPADAFSTLGWFADPIRPAMLDRDETSLVNLVLHEAAHRVLYLDGQTAFNESFASFVGDSGTLRFLESRRGAGCPLCVETAARYADAGRFSAFIRTLVEELEALYAEPVSREEKLRRREEVFDAARRRYGGIDWQSAAYDWFPGAHLDNAVVLSLQRYEGRRDVFVALLDHCGGDLARAIDAVRDLGWKTLPRKQRKATTPFAVLEDRVDTTPCP